MIAKLLISSSLDIRQKLIDKLLDKENITNPHPDLLFITDGEKLGIEQAKIIKEHFVYKPMVAKGKVAVVESADNMTLEAQNALLKTIEELSENSLLILGANTDAHFLPTVLSRLEITNIQDTDNQPETNKFADDIERLLNSNMQERFEYIEKLKDKNEFLNALTYHFRQKLLEKPDTKLAKFLGELISANEWAAQNVNIRGILEYLMIIMP